MDKHLQNLIRERRTEKCPPGVMENVRRRIRSESSRRRASFRFRLAVGAFAILLLATAVQWVRDRPRELSTPQSVAVTAEFNRQQIIEDATVSLASIGHLLIAAAESSETIISEQLLPPMQGGLQTLRNKLENTP